MKVALVHDYLREYGGAERVVEALHEIWPEAPLFTSFVDWEALGNQGCRFKGWDIRTSLVADNWLIRKFHSPLRFLAPKIWESFDLASYDVVISSSGWFMCRGIKAQSSKLKAQNDSTVRQKQGAVHICYMHHPPRNLYGYPTGSDLQKYWLVRSYATVVNFFLRHYDWETAQKVDYFIANSEETKRRVWKFYRRESMVIYPPIEGNSKYQAPKPKQIPNSKFQILKKDYYLSVGRLTYSKRVDLAIEACKKLKLPLKIVGTGKEEKYLRKLASPGLAGRSKSIEFLGSVSDEELGRLYAGAKALIFCALEEDFGMVPVEAMAHGTPVIALAQGGVVESIIDGKTGVFFREPTVTGVVEAIRRLEDSKTGRWEDTCKRQAEKFGKERFQRELAALVRHAIEKRKTYINQTDDESGLLRWFTTSIFMP